MPNQDGTGPMGYGGLCGRGMGPQPGSGFGWRRGRGGRFCPVDLPAPETEAEWLEAQKKRLEARLNAVNERLAEL